MLVDERRKLGGRLAVPPERELGIDPLLDCGQPQFLESSDRGARPVLAAKVGQRWSSPEAEGSF